MTDNPHLKYARQWAHDFVTSNTSNTNPRLLWVAKAINDLPKTIVDGDNIQDVISDLSDNIDDAEGLEGERWDGYIDANNYAIRKLTDILPTPRTLADMDDFERKTLIGSNVYIKSADSFSSNLSWQLVGVHDDTGAILHSRIRDSLPHIETFPLSELIPEFDGIGYDPKHLYSDNEGNIWGRHLDQWTCGDTWKARKDHYHNGHGHYFLPDKFGPYTQIT